MRVLVAHPGTQHSARLARELEARGLLEKFWTGLGFAAGSPSAWLAGAASRLPGLHGLASRVIPGVPGRRIRQLPGVEIPALWRLRRDESASVIHRRNESFQARIPERDLREADAVIGFDTSSWLLAERAGRLGRPFFLDRTIAHPRAHERIMREIAAQHPDWAAASPVRPPELSRAEDAEHALARRVVVGSPFVARTLAEDGIPPEKVVINPYGVDWEQFAPTEVAPSPRPLRFLFAGSILARKGVPTLLEAWRSLGAGEAELWLAGYASETVRRLIVDQPGLRVLGPVPRGEMPAVYAQCDVFVLPTHFEGFSLAVLEALASGMPVITTPNSGAEAVISEPALGRLVAPGDRDQLTAALRDYLASPPDRSATRAAVARLKSQLSWEAYGDRWARLLRENT
ncbi:MAG TPA: glycosyltransferase family 4 protein [Lacunisphaera sp.]|nr:glycosyltransferase family 4 protein [Lacunisphaera sp.]